MPTRHSPFYTPFLALHAGGFLAREGIESALRLPSGGESTGAVFQRGEADVIQSAVSAAWTQIEKGTQAFPVHIAQINQRDGFFLVGREPEPSFTWSNLEGKTLLADHGHQPLIMLKWAAHNKRADWSRINVANLGSAAAMATAFLEGQGDYIHLQGGVPHQMAYEGAGYIVASAGEGLAPLAFSSIATGRAFAESDQRAPFLRAFGKAKEWARQTPAPEVASVVAPLFSDLSEPALRAAITDIQRIGSWEGGAIIPRDAYAEAERVFLWAQGMQRAHAYETVCFGA